MRCWQQRWRHALHIVASASCASWDAALATSPCKPPWPQVLPVLVFFCSAHGAFGLVHSGAHPETLSRAGQRKLGTLLLSSLTPALYTLLLASCFL